jgi:hypothetical protein
MSWAARTLATMMGKVEIAMAAAVIAPSPTLENDRIGGTVVPVRPWPDPWWGG